MYCPVCGNELQQVSIRNIEVDVCKGGCGGLWFDNYELKKFDEPHETEGESLLEIEKDESIVIDHDKQRNCPKCKDIIMMRHFFTHKHEVEMDECAQCGGVWLDHGELSHIRSQYKTEEERKAAADSYFSDIIDTELEPLRKESREQLDKAERFANVFRFLCPSYYIRGKQKWGAF